MSSCVDANLKPDRNFQNDCAELADSKPPEGPVLFFEGRAMSVCKAVSRVCQFLADQYPADPEKSPAAAFKDVASVDLLALDMDG